MRTKEEYENLINSSRLFDIDKDTNAVLYKTEWRRFTVLLVEYYSKFVLCRKSLDSYSMELMDTATECVKHYSVSKGISKPFVSRLNANIDKKDLYRVNEITYMLIQTLSGKERIELIGFTED